MAMGLIAEIVRKNNEKKSIREYSSASKQEKALIRKYFVHHLLGNESDGMQMLSEILEENGMSDMEEERKRELFQIIRAYFTNPSRSTRDILEDIGRINSDLKRVSESYRMIQKLDLVQDMFVYDSVYPRIIGTIKEQLIFRDRLEKVFKKNEDAIIPFAIEFHPSLGCDARCKECPNISCGNFQKYPAVGQKLTQENLEKIIDLGIELGVRRMSFAGGGEPMLSELTIPSIVYARSKSDEVNLALYTNGIKLSGIDESGLEKLVSSLDRIRISLDASNAEDWSDYKGVDKEKFNGIIELFDKIKRAREKTNSKLKIGASYISRHGTARKDILNFVELCHEKGLDFCDVKDCCGFENVIVLNYRSCNGDGKGISSVVDEIMNNSKMGKYGNMHVALEDFFVSEWYLQQLGIQKPEIAIPRNCWMARINRKLTIGPYGELYPCSDSANPGVLKALNGGTRMAVLTDFSDLDALKKQFLGFLKDTKDKRDFYCPRHHPYCVASNVDYNIAIEKLFSDWDAGIKLEDQPIAPGKFDYLESRGIK